MGTYRKSNKKEIIELNYKMISIIIVNYNVKSYFPSEPLENTIDTPELSIAGASFYSDIESHITTLTIQSILDEKILSIIYKNKYSWLENALNMYLTTFYDSFGVSFKYDILEKIKFNNLYDGYTYQVNADETICHKGDFFILDNVIYNMNIKGSCDDMELINQTYFLMKENFEIIN